MLKAVTGKIYAPNNATAAAFIAAFHAAKVGTGVELRIASDDLGEFFIAAQIEGVEGIYMLAEENVLTIFEAAAYAKEQTGLGYAQDLIEALTEALDQMRQLSHLSKGTRH